MDDKTKTFGAHPSSNRPKARKFSKKKLKTSNIRRKYKVKKDEIRGRSQVKTGVGLKRNIESPSMTISNKPPTQIQGKSTRGSFKSRSNSLSSRTLELKSSQSCQPGSRNGEFMIKQAQVVPRSKNQNGTWILAQNAYNYHQVNANSKSRPGSNQKSKQYAGIIKIKKSHKRRNSANMRITLNQSKINCLEEENEVGKISNFHVIEPIKQMQQEFARSTKDLEQRLSHFGRSEKNSQIEIDSEQNSACHYSRQNSFAEQKDKTNNHCNRLNLPPYPGGKQRLKNKKQRRPLKLKLFRNNSVNGSARTIHQSPYLAQLSRASSAMGVDDSAELNIGICAAYERLFKNRYVDKLIVGEEIGKGSFGTVHRYLYKKDGSFLAVKEISSKVSEGKRRTVINSYKAEIESMSRLLHPNVVKYHGYLRPKGDSKSFLIVMDFHPGGSLRSFLEKSKGFPKRLIKIYAKQLLSGLSYIHKKGITHRDLKSDNILFGSDGQLKICDFGSSTLNPKLSQMQDSAVIITSELCCSIKGSWYWMAPEIINKTSYGRRVDIWSLGCVIYEMATGKIPWKDKCDFSLELKKMLNETKGLIIPKEVDPEVAEFIKACCVYKWTNRPTATKLLKHSFLKM